MNEFTVKNIDIKNDIYQIMAGWISFLVHKDQLMWRIEIITEDNTLVDKLNRAARGKYILTIHALSNDSMPVTYDLKIKDISDIYFNKDNKARFSINGSHTLDFARLV